MIDYAAITEAVRVWVRDSASLPDGQVILQDQTGRELQPPYATVRVNGSAKAFPMDYAGSETDLTQAAGQEVERFVAGHRVITAAVNIFTKGAFGGAGATSMLSNARDRLELESVQAAFAAAGAALSEASDVRNLSALLETNFQGRAHLELKLLAVSVESERTGYISSIAVEGTIKRTPGDADPIDVAFTVPTTP